LLVSRLCCCQSAQEIVRYLGKPNSLTGAEKELVESLQVLAPVDIVLAENGIRHFQRGGVNLYYFIRPLEYDGSSYRVFYCDVSFVSDAARNGAAGMAALGIVLSCFVFLTRKKSMRLLQRKDELIENFVSNLSHELKTPLAVVVSQIEAIQLGAVEVEDGLRSIRGSAERMTVVVDAIIAMSRLEAGAVRPKMRRCDVRESVYDAADETKRLFEEKGVVLEIEAATLAPVRGDTDMLFSIFQNLLSNALRYADNRVRVTVFVEDKTTVVVEVANDGISISEEDMGVVFDRFAKGQGGKTGIGLALAAEYVQIHEGDIEAYPLDEGTSVVVRLPSAI
ncbi:sensor histidine kinase, partial [Adlercreutzia caecimuris]|uniref:sensor histidine kinase n=1 Tax=Adlercreutzia caecimuris TaxID=671266 RepID=UPI001B3B2F63